MITFLATQIWMGKSLKMIDNERHISFLTLQQLDRNIVKDASNAVVAELTESDPNQLEQSQMVKRRKGLWEKKSCQK